MDIRELRLGLWVRIKDEVFDTYPNKDLYKTQEFEIYGIGDGSDRDGCELILHYEIPTTLDCPVLSGVYDDEMEPIPLNKDCLERFGFVFGFYGFSHEYNERLNIWSMTK